MWYGSPNGYAQRASTIRVSRRSTMKSRCGLALQSAGGEPAEAAAEGHRVGATYTYSHAIDNAFGVGRRGRHTPVQNFFNLAAEEGNSSFDQRHNLTGNWVHRASVRTEPQVPEQGRRDGEDAGRLL
jgi:hypothetical protein